MKTLQLKQDFYWAGILDKNLRVFDIIMYTEFGTTYNSYILKAGDETILFETAKEKFFGEYRAALSEQLDIAQIDYIVVDHTEPDHAGSIAHIIAENPQAKIIATPTAISFLKNIVNDDFYSIPVKNGDELKIGNKTLQFFLLPNLHWPDTMYTYIKEDKTLVTCDSFGSHYAHEGILRSTVTDTEGYLRATKYYFDNILGPFKQPYMTNALELVHSLDIDMICPGHGPVLDSHIPELLAIYAEWCKIPTNEKTTVVIPYVSAYGYTEQPAFLNGAIELETLFTPQELLIVIHKIEAELGRERVIHWGPRTIDLDIVFYDDEIVAESELIIPHIDMQNRLFVLEPLYMLCPGKVHPVLHKTVAQLRQELISKTQNKWSNE